MFWERFFSRCAEIGTRPNPVAQAIGVSSGAVTNWKATGAIPNGDVLAKIADHLQCSVDYLLCRTDAPTMPNAGSSFSAGEVEVIKKYRVLDERGKSAVLATLNHEFEAIAGDTADTVSRAGA